MRFCRALPASIIVALSMLTGAVGCGRDEVYPTHRPKVSDLVGTYQYSESHSSYELPNGGGPNARITLNANGTYVATGVPLSMPDSPPRTGPDRGTWAVDDLDGYSDEGITLTSSKSTGGSPLQIILLYDGPPYELAFNVDDPDQQHFICYQKVK